MVVAVIVDVGLIWTVEVLVAMTVDGVSVLVPPVTPSHEQAEEYLAVPEHAEAYAGTLVEELVRAEQVPAGALEVVLFLTGGPPDISVVVLYIVLVTTIADGWVIVKVFSIQSSPLKPLRIFFTFQKIYS